VTEGTAMAPWNGPNNLKYLPTYFGLILATKLQYRPAQKVDYRGRQFTAPTFMHGRARTFNAFSISRPERGSCSWRTRSSLVIDVARQLRSEKNDWLGCVAPLEIRKTNPVCHSRDQSRTSYRCRLRQTAGAH